ncbi:RNA polymerase sigma factor [Gloeobacter kilaueensis JS1]|uniref:RNA polymerase sigma factor n=2 Tax=Gloeobacter TaxID=33071 RepID=U5QM53_GLOK1|nr:RNA polymerase sigma factor [Gloeobacter kilaueensis JS1]
MDALNDIEAYRALKQGNASALSLLYDRHGGVVYRLALRLLGSSEEAEDLSQEVFLQLWQKQTYDPARGSLSNFLLTLTRSRAIDRLRSRGARGRFLQRWMREGDVGIAAGSPFERLAADERSERVQTALKTLPEAQRQALELAYYEGLSQSEIAQRLDTPIGTVKSRSRQGLLKLRNLLFDLLG